MEENNKSKYFVKGAYTRIARKERVVYTPAHPKTAEEVFEELGRKKIGYPCYGCLEVENPIKCKKTSCTTWKEWAMKRWDKIYKYGKKAKQLRDENREIQEKKLRENPDAIVTFKEGV